jgi:lipopolysaccharide biosynthesis glycosyltransferase
MSQMSQKAIITLSVGYQQFFDKTHPLMQIYSQRIGADFIKITGSSDQLTTIPSGYKLEKFQIHNYLSIYDRVIYLDGDMVIHPQCPNLFDLVPENKLGVVCEVQPYFNREKVFREACDFYGANYPHNFQHWFNTGMMVLSRQHQIMFEKPQKIQEFPARNADGSIAPKRFTWLDMPLLNCSRLIYNIEFQDLGFKFNYIQSLENMSDRPFEPEDSFIFHACGEDKSYIDKMIKIWYSQS